MAVRDFKKFFKRRGRFMRQPQNDKKTSQRSRDDKNSKSGRKCFRCGDPNHLIGECLKPPRDKNQRALSEVHGVIAVKKMMRRKKASSVSASFRRDVRDGAERQQWDDLSSIMNSVVLSSSKDRWTCDLSGDGEFKVKVIRNFIDDLFLPSSDVATRWVKFIPIKVNVFSWRARRDRLPTRVNLSRRGVLLDSHLCPLCNAAMEDVQHVFFRCDVARVVLRKICRWWDLDWQEICSFSDWDAWFLSFRLSSRLKSILEGVFYVAWWRIWRLRNQLVFDASPPNRSTIFDDIILGKRFLVDMKEGILNAETSFLLDHGCLATTASIPKHPVGGIT
ncbi:RNA-directed DNA polymerase, eukaryota [Tanacetum coccineum]